jgi:ADP-ribose pyrophosphatase YjhB (NUDIX family)
MKCYVVLYSQEGCFLTFTKRNLAYFYHDTNEINPVGFSIENGSGQFTFSGGRFNDDEEPFKACLRKFTEECGKEIFFEFFTSDQSQSESLLTLRNMKVNGARCEVLLSFLNTVPNNYHTLYLEFSPYNLRKIRNMVTNTNIAQANRARIGIYNKVIQNYDEIFRYNLFCPLNDKLFNSELWQIEREIDKIRLLSQNQTTNGYYEMIVYLANDILNASIPY